MSTKRFCDGPCGRELPPENRVREVSIADKVLDLRVGRAGWCSEVQEADLCKYCLIDALVQLDDRPKTDCASELTKLVERTKSRSIACDHAELVRLVKEYEAAYTGQANCSIGISLVARNNLLRYARTLP